MRLFFYFVCLLLFLAFVFLLCVCVYSQWRCCSNYEEQLSLVFFLAFLTSELFFFKLLFGVLFCSARDVLGSESECFEMTQVVIARDLLLCALVWLLASKGKMASH